MCEEFALEKALDLS